MNQILVVEDEPEIQELLAAYLRSEVYMVTIAGDGVSALDKFHSVSCNLVLLDIMLPKIDGVGVCKPIRQEAGVYLLHYRLILQETLITCALLVALLEFLLFLPYTYQQLTCVWKV